MCDVVFYIDFIHSREMSNKDLKNELDDKANWPKPIEEHFIHLLYEEAKKACKPII